MFPPPILIDEVQYAPELFPQIKLMADRSGERGLFWLTGSQRYDAMRAVQESLAGRVAILEMMGLSRAELQNTLIPNPPDYSFAGWQRRSLERTSPDTPELFEQIWRGGLSEIQKTRRLKCGIHCFMDMSEVTCFVM